MLNKSWHDDKGRWVKLRKQAGEGKPLSLRFFFPSLIPSADPEARSACGCPLGLKRPSWSGPQLEGQTGEGTAPAPRAQERSAPHVCVSGDDAPPEMWTRPPEISKQAAIAGMSQGKVLVTKAPGMRLDGEKGQAKGPSPEIPGPGTSLCPWVSSGHSQRTTSSHSSLVHSQSPLCSSSTFHSHLAVNQSRPLSPSQEASSPSPSQLASLDPRTSA